MQKWSKLITIGKHECKIIFKAYDGIVNPHDICAEATIMLGNEVVGYEISEDYMKDIAVASAQNEAEKEAKDYFEI